MNGPDFAGVIAMHEPLANGWHCSCQPINEDGAREVLPTYFEAHLSAALYAELARWLADEGTRERVAEGLRLMAGTGARTYGFPDIATAALAALTTTDQESDR